MRQQRHGELKWTPGDQVAYARWRRGVFLLYGCLGLAALAVFSIYQVARGGITAASAVAFAPTQISIPSSPPMGR
jgi:hypothetical protein